MGDTTTAAGNDAVSQLQEKYDKLAAKHADVTAKAKGRLIELSTKLKTSQAERVALQTQVHEATARLTQFKTLTVKKVGALRQKITELEQHQHQDEHQQSSGENDDAMKVEYEAQLAELRQQLEAKAAEAARFEASDKKMRETLGVVRTKTKEKVRFCRRSRDPFHSRHARLSWWGSITIRAYLLLVYDKARSINQLHQQTFFVLSREGLQTVLALPCEWIRNNTIIATTATTTATATI